MQRFGDGRVLGVLSFSASDREGTMELGNFSVMMSEADESTTGPASFMGADADGNTILVHQHV